jgi:NACalpha-BTF3-like transcription factor
MKYHKNPPTITIIEDDVELVTDKVQVRGEVIVHATEAQRE